MKSKSSQFSSIPPQIFNLVNSRLFQESSLIGIFLGPPSSFPIEGVTQICRIMFVEPSSQFQSIPVTPQENNNLGDSSFVEQIPFLFDPLGIVGTLVMAELSLPSLTLRILMWFLIYVILQPHPN